MNDENLDLPDPLTAQQPVEKKSVFPTEWVYLSCFWLRPLQAESASLFLGVFAIYTQIDEILPWTDSSNGFSFLSHASVEIYAILIFIAVLIAWILSGWGNSPSICEFYRKTKR